MDVKVAAVINVRTQKHLVRMAERDGTYVYIGRPSIWGNPYSHEKDSLAQWRVKTRAEAIECYEAWLLNRPDLLARLPELDGKWLGCWCRPLSCHGEVLARFVANPPVPVQGTLGF